ncbi:uncharacterized protein LOC124253250 [Haliotis rubra]|uniref:uncharacterized protein LOC124253250 n=1 Tax=Haliotis rubra TaxID=36100 RepID=UPI001EE61334|nr:uncharacterized protein LOC124253250 [Haliotis rubra]
MAEDNQAVSDLKSMEKGARMFSANRVLACSVYFEGSSTYFSGIVGASMKNKVSYNYKIKVDKTGAPVISHCECPAGKGRHATCKHIAAVLIMAEHFVATGSLHVEKSCTENLQTFHKPKSTYKGSPVKAESLPSKRKWSDKMLEDLRPPKYRRMAGFDDHVRNMMVNFCSATSEDLALRYLHPKADLQTAVKDHDYLDKPFSEYWVDRALQVTKDDAVQIEKSTRDQGNNQRWHREEVATNSITVRRSHQNDK